jgi:hypothetical protein
MYLIDANKLLEVLYKKANGKNATNSLTSKNENDYVRIPTRLYEIYHCKEF